MPPVKFSAPFLSLVTTGPTWLCRFAPLLFLGLGTALAQPGSSGGVADVDLHGLRPTRVNVVASNKMFFHVNQNDARAALKLWFESVARRRGFLLDCKVDIVNSAAEIRERLLSRSVDVIIPDITEYFELEGSRLMVPALTLALNAQAGAHYSYVLLVNPSSALTTIAGLRGKNILAFSRGGSNTAMAWIDVLLAKEKLGRAASFFASVKLPAKGQACILPLFFGAVDACAVDEVSLNLAREMNPQLGKLTVLARSRLMIESVIATTVAPHPYRTEMIDAILSLHEDVSHRQLLMVFRADRILRFQPGDLDSARELWRDYYRLPGSSPLGPAGSAPASPVESNQLERGKERR